MSKLLKTVFLLFSACFILTGCAESRGYIDLSEIVKNDLNSTQNNKTVFIDKYIDTRKFSTNASTPDQPTYNPRVGLNDDEKSRIIARKRDSFGKALGDILLKDNLTTEKLVRNVVAQSFVDAGYNVVDEDPENKAVKCNIIVNKLWGWISPGFWSIGVVTNTELTLDLSYNNKSDSIHTYQKEETRGSFITSKGWRTTFKNNFFSVKQDLTDKIRKSPISK